MTRSPWKPLLALTAAAVLVAGLAGCGANAADTAAHTSSSKSVPKGMMRMPDGTLMKTSDMPGMSSGDQAMGDMTSTGGGPSQSASEICSNEIMGTVKRTFALRSDPTRGSRWNAHSKTYSCDYQLPHSTLKLSVRDLTKAGPGRAYFDQLRKSIPGATPIKGMQSFNFPAFQSPHGDVGFLKDDKTLWVDASGVKQADLPPGFSREGMAYAVAAAVIACWSE